MTGVTSRRNRRVATDHAARPRFRRITAAGVAGSVTVVAVLGATGLLPTSNSPEPAFAAATSTNEARAGAPAPSLAQTTRTGLRLSGWAASALPRSPDRRRAPVVDDELPQRSGQGRRIVFDMSDQRVWLVKTGNDVRRTYLVSGSLTDNLSSGRYEVYSKSRDAIGIDDSGTMRFMVRFAHGTRAAIGFHDIPVHRGKLVQTAAELGTPKSHGCIRQHRPDAKALWRFAPVGTRVVVLD